MNQVTLCDPPWISRDGLLMVGGHPLRVIRLSQNHSKYVRRLLNGEPVQIDENNSKLIDVLVNSGIARPLHLFAEEAIEQISEEIEVIFAITSEVETALESAKQLFEGKSPLKPKQVRFFAPTRELRKDFIKQFTAFKPNVTVAENNKSFSLGLRASTMSYLAFTSDRISISGEEIKLLTLAMIDDGAELILPRIIGAPERFLTSPLSSLISHFEEKRSLSDAGSNWTNLTSTTFINNDSSQIFVTKRTTAVGIGDFHEITYDESQREFISRTMSDNRHAVYEPGIMVRQTTPKSSVDFAKTAFHLGCSSVELSNIYPRSTRKAAVKRTKLVALAFPILFGRRGFGLFILLESLILAQTGQKLAGIKGGDIAAIQIELKSDAHLMEELGKHLRQVLGLPMLITLPFLKPIRRLLLATAVMSIVESLRNTPKEETLPAVLLMWAQDIAYSAGLWKQAIKKRSIRGVFPKLLDVRLKRPA